MNDIGHKFDFVAEIDQLKAVERQTLNIDGKRRENTAEHSWSLAMAVMVFSEYTWPATNIGHCLELALTHDLVEIYAGDTFAYDTDGLEVKRQRELDSARKLFKLDQPIKWGRFNELWEEYEKRETPESIYVNALDRLLPIFFNMKTNGHSWQKHGVTSKMVLERNDIIKKASAELWEYTLKLVEQGVEKGYLIKE